MNNPSQNLQAFDFEAHSKAAVEAYRVVRVRYEQAVDRISDILREALNASGTKVLSVEGRAKDLESFGRKASHPSDSDPNRPKYPSPLQDIKDLAGVRVITFSPKTLSIVEGVIEHEFDVIEKTDKGKELSDEGKFGYQSIHYLVRMTLQRTALPEYGQISDLTAEIQVRTILQHAWAEMEHDIQYKSAAVIPTSIRRRFVALAGVIEIADREFQSLQEEDERLRAEAQQSLEAGKLGDIEITPDVLRSYLNQKFGPDRRMTDFSYDLTARLLRRMGFQNLQQIDQCVQDFDDDRVSRAVAGTRLGQISRFEYVLEAAMGDNYRRLHPWWSAEFKEGKRSWVLERLRASGITPGKYEPPPTVE